MILYRPVGLKELALIAETGYGKFPPRLPEQPIFYPVLTFEYAEQIARDWNSTSGDCAGFVTRFEIEDAYISKFEVHTVGRRGLHDELWVPAGELEKFNYHIIGKITVEASYYGEGFEEEVDPESNLPVSIGRESTD
ncbi:MAG: ADP-ribosylation/crystallin J1 [Anaerolineae bacterium]|nr:ADP-ribosylation/crystallin J1 [Anaerolineae bacterium]